MQDEEGDNVDLEETKVEKDLGVHIDNELKFSEHIHTSVKKANSVLGIIKRNFVNFDSKTLCQLYKSLVRPLLEYGNTSWSPKYIKDDIAIERVRRLATK